MPSIAFVDTHGEVKYVVQSATGELIQPPNPESGLVAIEAPGGVPDYVLIELYYWKEEWRQRTARPSEFYVWGDEAWAEDLSGARSGKLRQVKQERERRGFLPIQFAGASWDADDIGRRNIQGWLLVIQSGESVPEGMVWRDADNVDHPADAAFFGGLWAAIVVRGTMLYQASWAHKAAIESLSTLQDIQGYNVSENWP